MTERTPLTERLANPHGVLTRTDLRELGWQRRAIDAIFRACPPIRIPGYTRDVIRVSDYVAFLEANTFRDDRVLE